MKCRDAGVGVARAPCRGRTRTRAPRCRSGVWANALPRVGQALAQRELAQPRVEQRLERVGQRAAEQFDGVGVDQLAQQRAGAVPPERLEVVERLLGLGVLANAEGRATTRVDRMPAASCARSCQFASQWCMPSRQYGSSSWAVTTGVMPRVSRSRRPSAASVRSTRISGQVGRRPRLVEPFLADGPAAVVGQPRQVGVQDQGEHARVGAPVRVGHGRTAIATRSQAVVDGSASVGLEQVEVVDGDRRDVGQQVVRPRRVGQRAVDLGVDDRAAVLGVELTQPWAVEARRSSARREAGSSTSSSVSSAALSSRVWNGLSGVSRPGEKVIRLGVRHQQHAAGPQHPASTRRRTVPGPTGAR